LGFKEDWIYEVIVETPDNHAAPMGISLEGVDELKLWVYKTSKTHDKLKEGRKFRVFFPKDSLAVSDVLESKRVDSSRTHGFLEVKVVGEADFSDLTQFVCEVTAVEAEDVVLINRAEGLLAELLIESTKPKRDTKLMKKIAAKIRKVAPYSDFDKKADEIIQGLL